MLSRDREDCSSELVETVVPQPSLTTHATSAPLVKSYDGPWCESVPHSRRRCCAYSVCSVL